MIWQKNNGTSQDEVLQNQFTAYVKRAVYHQRLRYLTQRSKRESHETELIAHESVLADPNDYMRAYIEMDALRRAIQGINDKERQIVLAHVIDEKSFVEIAVEMDMTYKAVTCLYYRVMRKLRESMEGDERQ